MSVISVSKVLEQTGEAHHLGAGDVEFALERVAVVRTLADAFFLEEGFQALDLAADLRLHLFDGLGDGLGHDLVIEVLPAPRQVARHHVDDEQGRGRVIELGAAKAFGLLGIQAYLSGKGRFRIGVLSGRDFRVGHVGNSIVHRWVAPPIASG